jgi:hypothetical protein
VVTTPEVEGTTGLDLSRTVERKVSASLTDPQVVTTPEVEGHLLTITPTPYRAINIQNHKAKIVKIEYFVPFISNLSEAQILMAADQTHHDDALRGLRLWAKRQVLRVEALSKQEVLCELQGIMEGHSYSWNRINDLLQARLDEGSLEFSFADGDVLFEWNNLCYEKRMWEKRGRLSVDNAEFNMACLINLKILPVQAGLGIEGRLAFWFH